MGCPVPKITNVMQEPNGCLIRINL
ncbi:hypothetical protein PO124_33035 [Bacillus licheniformis]|nr:hypothetical protein [Bacillus licheniformis]